MKIKIAYKRLFILIFYEITVSEQTYDLIYIFQIILREFKLLRKFAYLIIISIFLRLYYISLKTYFKSLYELTRNQSDLIIVNYSEIDVIYYIIREN